MILFDIKDGDVVIIPASITVPEFQAIWQRDKGKGKSQALNELKYVYHICDFKAPYAKYPQATKENYIRMDLFKEQKWEPDALVEKAIKKYKELNESPSQRLLAAVEFKMDEVSTFIKATPLNIKTQRSIMDVISKISKILSERDKIEEAVNKETKSGRIRGGHNKSLFEDE